MRIMRIKTMGLLLVLVDALLLMTIVYVVKFRKDFNENNINKIIAVIFFISVIALLLSSCSI